MSSKLTYSNLTKRESIGEGAFGIVHRVTFKEPYQGLTEAAAKSIREIQTGEVEILKNLDHPHIVRLYGYIQENFLNLIILEYAKNGTVYDYIKKHGNKPVSHDLLLKWTLESAKALEYLHDNRVLHRDVKGSNCLLFDDYVLKLSDFGLAREITTPLVSSSAKGTWRYVAPEIHKEHHYSFASDVWAYGMLIIEMLTGRVPFEWIEVQKVIYDVTKNKLTPDIPENCPEVILTFLPRCWHENADDRPSAAEIVLILNDTGKMEGNYFFSKFQI